MTTSDSGPRRSRGPPWDVQDLQLPAELLLELPDPPGRGVQDGDVGAHAHGEQGGLGADDATAEDGDPGGRDARRATQEQARPAGRMHEVVTGGVRGQSSGNLAHRLEKGQLAAVVHDRLVGDGGDATIQERLGQRAIGGQVQVGEQHGLLPQPVVLGGDRLLDLDHQLGRPGVGDRHDLGARALVVVVGDPSSQAGSALDEHVMAVGAQRPCAGIGQRHPALAGLGLLTTPMRISLVPFDR